MTQSAEFTEIHKRMPYGLKVKNLLLCILMILPYYKHNEIDKRHWDGLAYAYCGV